MQNLNSIESLRNEINDPNVVTDNRSKNYFLHAYNRFIHELEVIKRFHKGGKILEIGSAPFFQTRLLSMEGLNITGIDIHADKHNSFLDVNELNVVQCDIENEKIPFEDESFQTVLLLEVFEHLRINPILTLIEIKRVLKAGGHLIIQTPNLYSLKKLKRYLFGRGFDHAYSEFNKINQLGYSGHVRIYTMRQVNEFLLKTGFFILHKEFNTYNRYGSNSNFLKRIIEGFFPGLRHHMLVVAEKK